MEGTLPFTPADPAAARIREAARRGALSHALLLTGGGDRLALARYAAAALECVAAREARPCGVCAACRKVFRDIHPDIVTVRDEEHKNISAAVIRAMRQDAWIQPNEGNRKVYLFPDCALLTEQDQNLLLKVVEEGPPYAAFLFCAESGGQVLQTLRSRCVELRLRTPPEDGGAAADGRAADSGTDAVTEARGGAGGRRTGTAGQSAGADRKSARGESGSAKAETLRGEAEDLCRRGVRRGGAVAELAAKLERKKLSREDLGTLLAWCREAYAAALLSLYGRPPGREYGTLPQFLANNLTKRRLASIIELLGRYCGVCSATNAGPGHVLGALAVEWEELP